MFLVGPRLVENPIHIHKLYYLPYKMHTYVERPNIVKLK